MTTSFKIGYFIFGFLTVSTLVKADLPYMPVSFIVSTAKESYYEGERVEFIMTITNNDTSKAYPILIPHTQNTGQKLIYFNVYDPYQKAFLERAKDSRDIDMMVHDTGSVKKILLQPREVIKIPFYYNDFENYFNYHTQIASHHKTNIPLFAGEYWIHAYYNPFGIPMGDTLYNVYDDFDKLSQNQFDPNKLVLYATGMASTCMLKIKKAPPGIITIQGVQYICKDVAEKEQFHYNKNQQYFYYLKEDTIHYIAHVQASIDSYIAKSSTYIDKEKSTTYFILRNNDNSIKYYWKQKNNCPTEIEKREFNDSGKLVYQAYLWRDSTVHQTAWHDDGRVKYEGLYSADAKTYTLTKYIYNKSLKLLRKEVEIQTDPCIVFAIELNTNNELK